RGVLDFGPWRPGAGRVCPGLLGGAAGGDARGAARRGGDAMEMTPDTAIVFSLGGFGVNATIVFTWIVMAILTLASVLITRNLRPDVPPDRWRTTLEAIVLVIQSQIDEISARPDRRVLYFSGTLFLFIIT